MIHGKRQRVASKEPPLCGTGPCSYLGFASHSQAKAPRRRPKPAAITRSPIQRLTAAENEGPGLPCPAKLTAAQRSVGSIIQTRNWAVTAHPALGRIWLTYR